MRNEKSSKKATIERTGNELPKRRRICKHFPLLIVVSEGKITSAWPTIYPELSGTLVIISHIAVSDQ
jgi:hypothetical protein